MGFLMKPTRKAISPRKREGIISRLGGKCVQCGSNQLLHIDHIIALENGGADDETNFQLLCHPCHKIKTKSDVKIIAKVRSVRQKYEAPKQPSKLQSRGFPKKEKTPLIDKTNPPRRFICGQPIGE